MGTKNNPGNFDCYHNADPDEPMFILLGRDKHAPLLVKLWADLRAMEGEDHMKVCEAIQCATNMAKFRAERQSKKTTGLTGHTYGDHRGGFGGDKHNG